MAAKQYLTESVCLYIGYSYTQGVSGTGGTASLAFGTNLSSVIVPAVDVLYRRIVRQGFAIRQIGLSCPVYPDTGAYQLNMFEDTEKQLRGKASSGKGVAGNTAGHPLQVWKECHIKGHQL